MSDEPLLFVRCDGLAVCAPETELRTILAAFAAKPGGPRWEVCYGCDGQPEDSDGLCPICDGEGGWQIGA